MLIRNRNANKAASWTPEQDAILSDAAYRNAAKVITAWDGYAVTPLHVLSDLAKEAGVGRIHYKDEAERFGLDSFKALGGAYAVARLAADAEASLTVCCATDGNHGRSVAWGARLFGCKAVIFVHAAVSKARKEAIEAYGAEVRRTPGNYDDSVRIAGETAAAEGWLVISDTSYPGYMDIPCMVMQGYEVMAAEAFDGLAEPPTQIFLQTGVGGMAAAVAAQAKRRWGEERPMIILADPENAACWVESFRAGQPTTVGGDLDTMMAGLACGEVSLLAWKILKDHGDAAIAIPDNTAFEFMRRLARPSGSDPTIVAGESAVAGLAGVFAAKELLGLNAQSHALVFGTEGATDPDLYQRIVGADRRLSRSAKIEC